MKLEKNLFGQDVPDKKIIAWHVPLPGLLIEEIRIRFTRQESDETIHRTGGYQGVVNETLERLDDDGTLEVDYLYIGRVFRASYTPTGGGWETTFKQLLYRMEIYFSRPGEEFEL